VLVPFPWADILPPKLAVISDRPPVGGTDAEARLVHPVASEERDGVIVEESSQSRPANLWHQVEEKHVSARDVLPKRQFQFADNVAASPEVNPSLRKRIDVPPQPARPVETGGLHSVCGPKAAHERIASERAAYLQVSIDIYRLEAQVLHEFTRASNVLLSRAGPRQYREAPATYHGVGSSKLLAALVSVLRMSARYFRCHDLFKPFFVVRYYPSSLNIGRMTANFFFYPPTNCDDPSSVTTFIRAPVFRR